MAEANANKAARMRLASDFMCAEKTGWTNRTGRATPLTREAIMKAFAEADMVLDVYDELYPEKAAGRGRSTAA